MEIEMIGHQYLKQKHSLIYDKIFVRNNNKSELFSEKFDTKII